MSITDSILKRREADRGKLAAGRMRYLGLLRTAAKGGDTLPPAEQTEFDKLVVALGIDDEAMNLDVQDTRREHQLATEAGKLEEIQRAETVLRQQIAAHKAETAEEVVKLDKRVSEAVQRRRSGTPEDMPTLTAAQAQAELDQRHYLERRAADFARLMREREEVTRQLAAAQRAGHDLERLHDRRCDLFYTEDGWRELQQQRAVEKRIRYLVHDCDSAEYLGLAPGEKRRLNIEEAMLRPEVLASVAISDLRKAPKSDPEEFKLMIRMVERLKQGIRVAYILRNRSSVTERRPRNGLAFLFDTVRNQANFDPVNYEFHPAPGQRPREVEAMVSELVKLREQRLRHMQPAMR